MAHPELSQSGIERDSFLQRFNAARIAAFDADSAERGCFKKNHSLITIEFGLERRAQRGEKAARLARPVSGAVHRSPVAKQNASGIMCTLHVFEIALELKDSRLRDADDIWLP